MDQLPRIFIAYAREDAHLLEKLRKPLNVLRRNGHCDIFFDGEIVPGERWDKRLKDELHQADIYILLVTDDFLDSDYINDVELPKALDKEKEGKAKVVPIILRPCMWQYTLLKEFQVVLYEGKPIEPSGGYVHAVEQVARVIEVRNETLRIGREAAERKLEEARQKSEAEAEHQKKAVEEERQRKAAEALKQKEEAERQRRRAADPFNDLMIPIKGGSFKMGDQYAVTLKDFHLCKHPVTQAQWRAIMGSDPSRFKGDDLPVEKVNWNDVQDFIKKLNAKTGENYRLPSEAEWEFAARGGNQCKNFQYAGSNDINEVGWFWENSGDIKLSGDWKLDQITNNNCRTHPVMQKKANELGLYDMSGNVWEWCQDTWHDSLDGIPKNGSAWTAGGKEGIRVVRGGSWVSSAGYCRSAYRVRNDAVNRSLSIGFRLAR